MISHRKLGSLTRNRRGSALILVLIMTLSLAGLAMSAIYLSSSAGLLSRYYDRERNYRYAAEAAIALGKSRIQMADSSLHLLDTGAKALLTAASLKDANGVTIPRILVNLYGANTGDTVGVYGQFVTLLAQAYDSGGTRMVRRLDLTAESFSRFAMFTNTFSGGLAYGPGEYIRGRAHSNQVWNSAGVSVATGPTYFDTVSANGAIGGIANYSGLPNVPGAPIIPMPTIAKLAALTTYASGANLQFTPVTATSGSAAPVQGLGTSTINLSGQVGGGNPTVGTRVSFRPVDVNNNGTVEQAEGMMMIFDLATGMDTASLRVDFAATPTTNAARSDIVLMNQCGLLMHFPAGTVVAGGPTFAAAHNEFFPLSRFRELWVRKRIIAAGVGTAVGNTAITGGASPSDTAVMGQAASAGWAGDSLQPIAVYNKVLNYGIGNTRCFPAGSPLLMLTERNTTAACVITQATGVAAVYGWGGTGGLCATTLQYGGMDTTFTPRPMRCAYLGRGSTGKCGATGVNTGVVGQVALGTWRTWAGAALPAIPVSVIQANEVPYLWPLFLPYNMNSKGVINSTTGPVYLSDTLRGFITFYQSNATKDIVIIDDLVYDKDPTQASALCRNFLGIIAGQNILAANNGLNRPRGDPAGVVRWYGFPDFTLHAVTLALNGTVGVEDNASPGGPTTTPSTMCGAGNTTSGGCINQTGGVIEQVITATYSSGGNTGMRENRTVDPCQKTNSRPPFFPQTGRYLDNKYYEIDPTLVATPLQVVLFFASLRGKVVP
jgi:hypothetical protein